LVSTIYVEQEVAEHPVTRAICQRFGEATRISIGRYTEVFNRRAQNFRLQKKRPALILARKFHGHVLPTPPGYGIGATRSFYFSHMLNCVYDCRYCFLQGMYSSANYVVFVNYEDFEQALETTIEAVPGATTCFFSGYDCDSLALEPVTGFVETVLPLFQRYPDAWLELRTKSTQIRALLKREAMANVIVAFSFTPEEISQALEYKVPRLGRRIEALVALQRAGWPLGLRFDPLVFSDDYRTLYRRLFAEIFSKIRVDALHSVSLGPFRVPRDFHRRMQRLYPDERLFAGRLEERDGLVSYPPQVEEAMRAYCTEELLGYVPETILYPCQF
jgi:spore photoproduct lyase